MKQSIRFIVNPISGVGKKNIIPGLIKKHLDHDVFTYDIVYTEYKLHAKALATEASKEGVDIVCAVGGDGSVHEVGTALARFGITTWMDIRDIQKGINFEEAIV